MTLKAEVPVVCYSLELADSWGDGWHGGYLTIVQDDVALDEFTIEDGAGRTEEYCLNASSFSVEWTGATFVNEVSFSLTAPDGDVVCASEPSPQDGVSCTVVPTCDQALAE